MMAYIECSFIIQLSGQGHLSPANARRNDRCSIGICHDDVSRLYGYAVAYYWHICSGKTIVMNGGGGDAKRENWKADLL